MVTPRDTVIDVPFNRGIRQDIETTMAPPGTLARCENLEFDKLGRLQRRESFSEIGDTRYAKSSSFQAPARRFAAGPKGEFIVFTDDGAHTWNFAANKMTEVGAQGVPAVQRAQLEDVGVVGGDQAGAIVSADAASYGDFLVVAYTQFNAAGPVFTYNTYVDVIAISTGEHVIMNYAVATGTSKTTRPRVVITSGIAHVLSSPVILGTINHSSIDLTASVLGFGVGGSLVTDADTVINCFDVAPTTDGFVLAYASFSGGNHRVHVVTYSSAAAVVHGPIDFVTAAAADWTPRCLGVVGASDNTQKIFVFGYDPATFKLEALITASDLTGVSHAAQDPGLDHGHAVRQLSAVRYSATDAIVAFSNYYYSTTSTNPAGHLYFRTLSNAGTYATIKTVANYTLGSHLYYDSNSGGVYFFARFNHPTEAESHLLLMSLPQVSSTDYPYPEFHIASGRITAEDYSAVGVQIPIGGIAELDDAGRFILAFPIRLGASTISGSQVGLWTVQCRGNGRFLNVKANGGLLIAGGTPCFYDGQRITELGFYSYPYIASGVASASAAGGVIGQGVYFYRFTYEWTDALGNIQRSDAGPAIGVDMSSGTYAGNTNSVTINLPTLHATRKQRSYAAGSFSDTLSPIRIVAYRTTAGGSNFYKVGSVDPTSTVVGVNNTANVSDVTIVDTLADASITSNELLYTQRGELAETAPPPCSFMTVHDGRVWGLDDEQPERIWFSKTFQTLVSVGYNAALQVIIPGAGRIRGVAGQDGKLYALAETGIYLAAYGDGPDNTGQGAFASPQLITTNANCVETRSVLQASDGIYFVGDDQWGRTVFLIRRGDGTPINIGARIRDEIAGKQTCMGVVERRDKARIEFLFSDNQGESAECVLLYYHLGLTDEEGIGQWTTANYRGDNSPLGAIGLWESVGLPFTVGYDVGSATVVVQATTAGDDYSDASHHLWNATLETNDLRPFGILGYGQVDSVNLLATTRAACDLKFEASYDSGVNYAETVDFVAGSESAGAPMLRRWEPQTKKLPSGATRIRITDEQQVQAANAGARFHGIALEATPLGGLARLAAGQRG